MRAVKWAGVVFCCTVIGSAFAQERQKAATVHIVGVQHAPGQLLYESTSPAHVRAALAAIAPDVVCVESCPEWFAAGRFYRETWEASGIAMPWAKSRGLPVHGVDWIGAGTDDWVDRERIARVRRERDDLRAERIDARRFGFGAASRAQLRAVGASPEIDFARFNSEAFAREINAWQDGARDEKGSAQQYFTVRNGHIADHIAATAKQHPGAKIAVVIGAMHRGDLLRLLPARGLEVAAVPDLTALRAGDGDLAIDDLLAMLTFAMDNEGGRTPDAARLARLHEQLANVLEAGVQRDHAVLADYVAARRDMLDGKLDDAARAFAVLAQKGKQVRFPYRGGEWRLHLTVAQAARLELGRIADLAGRREQAVAAYKELLGTVAVPGFDEGYHSDFEFVACAHNAVRALLQTPFTAEMAFARRQVESGRAPATGELAKSMQRAWELHRSKQWQALRTAVAAIDASALSRAESLEVQYHLAAASLELGERDDAATRIADLEQRASDLGASHWLVKHLPDLRRRLQ
ncbi:MAG TPA: hypothetical protein VF384_03055 [Planctomycetota bacterium]